MPTSRLLVLSRLLEKGELHKEPRVQTVSSQGQHHCKTLPLKHKQHSTQSKINTKPPTQTFKHLHQPAKTYNTYDNCLPKPTHKNLQNPYNYLQTQTPTKPTKSTRHHKDLQKTDKNTAKPEPTKTDTTNLQQPTKTLAKTYKTPQKPNKNLQIFYRNNQKQPRKNTKHF